jgi:hypothetical protein
MMTRRKLTYADTCTIIRRLYNAGETKADICRALESAGYPGPRGGKKWWHKTLTMAMDDALATPKRKPRETKRPAQQSPRRRGLKRMVSETEWQSMPEPMQRALIDAILARIA